MDKVELNKVRKELRAFVEPYREFIGRSERMHWCRMYISGLLLNGERKSIQPMADRLPGGDMQSLQQFVNQSPWEHKAVMNKLLVETAKEFASADGVFVLDDTTFPKKGKKSVGVARQYCGALGKIANCQNIVSWHYSTSSVGKIRRDVEHWPIVGELYLPKEWTNDTGRMKKAGIPKERQSYIAKTRLALNLLDKFRQMVPHRAIVWDAFYGEDRSFRDELAQRGEKYVGAIPYSQVFWPLDTTLKTVPNQTGRPRKFASVKDLTAKAISAKSYGEKASHWKYIRLKTKKKKIVQATAIRVMEGNSQYYRKVGAECWLIIEKESSGDINYYVSNFPKETPLEELIYLVRQRWTVEQGYQRLKEELGLDHFEGRSWIGLHHHLTLCFMAYDFILRSKSTLKKTKFHFQRFDSGLTKSLLPVSARNVGYGLLNDIVHSSGAFNMFPNVFNT